MDAFRMEMLQTPINVKPLASFPKYCVSDNVSHRQENLLYRGAWVGLDPDAMTRRRRLRGRHLTPETRFSLHKTPINPQ
ncbi:hypothetical protein EYF80_048465 [Liparis tanakae]|uniref:Uncharacterized protein n=1 Tax=Liparis tanakae TaxID=230148 RepID=A0A4Z2FJK1_9TELE|nr:hypothetical protein EYF80_048465 [Liparis tanakae]